MAEMIFLQCDTGSKAVRVACPKCGRISLQILKDPYNGGSVAIMDKEELYQNESFGAAPFSCISVAQHLKSRAKYKKKRAKTKASEKSATKSRPMFGCVEN